MSESNADQATEEPRTDDDTGAGADDTRPSDLVGDVTVDADADLEARVELLEAENRRLREEYVRARRTTYRRAAAGLALVGLAAVAAALLFPAVREVLLVLGAIGLFGGVLTYFLTPERFVAAETGERVYAAPAETLGDLAAQLGLEEDRVYVPVAGTPPARLFVPQHADYELPDDEALSRPLVVTEERERGAAVVPSGVHLFAEFERTLAGPLGDTADVAVDQLADALVEGFELADATETDVDAEGGRATVGVTGAVYGDPEQFDNPLASFVAVGLTQALETPVRAEVTTDDEGFSVTCRWGTEPGS